MFLWKLSNTQKLRAVFTSNASILIVLSALAPCQYYQVCTVASGVSQPQSPSSLLIKDYCEIFSESCIKHLFKYDVVLRLVRRSLFCSHNRCSQPLSHKQCILLLPIFFSQVQTRLQTFITSLQQKTSEIEILAVSIWQKPELIQNF